MSYGATSAGGLSGSPPRTRSRRRTRPSRRTAIYAGWLASLDTDGTELERWPAAISVGTNPTFEGSDRTVEAYALDRDDLDLYGMHVAVEFAERIRGQVRFDSVDDLIAQMRQDVDVARQILTSRRP